MAATADGGGYWLVASDGGIFSYGDATFYGSTGAIRLNQPIVGMAPTPDGAGYWMVAADGGVFTFGDAGYYGSTAGTGVSALGIVIDPPAPGYAVVTTTGAASLFGPPAAAITQPTPPLPTSTTTTAPATTTTTDPPTTTTTTCHARRRRPPPATHDDDHHHRAPHDDDHGAARDDDHRSGDGDGTSDEQPPAGRLRGLGRPAGNGRLRPGDGDIADDRHRLPACERRLGGHGRRRREPRTGCPGPGRGPATRSRLGRADHSDQLERDGRGHAGPGATGAYNSYFVTLAQTLVAGRRVQRLPAPRLGVRRQLDAWYAGTPAPRPASPPTSSRSSRPCAPFPASTSASCGIPMPAPSRQSGYSVAAAYPGNAYVDVIGLDAYDQSWATPQTPTNAWSSTTLPSLTAAQQFASAEGKPLAFTEWGVTIRTDGHGLGDDPYYINHMVSWMETSSNDVVFESYFDDDTGGVNATITGGAFPESLAAFTADLG